MNYLIVKDKKKKQVIYFECNKLNGYQMNAKNKNIIITPNVEFVEFPELIEGMSYIKKSKNQIIVNVNTDKIHTQKALQELIKKFDIDDINIDNESLENIIRSIYEKN